jgi:hypothetical protein
MSKSQRTGAKRTADLITFIQSWFQAEIFEVCADRTALGPVYLVLYDVSTLHLQNDGGDGFDELDDPTPPVRLGVVQRLGCVRWLRRSGGLVCAHARALARRDPANRTA